MNNGSIGLSLFLVAIGATLAWAVNATVSGIDIKIVGAILMVVGGVGLALSLLFWASFAPFAERSPFGRRVAVRAAPGVERVIVHEPPTTIVRADSDPNPVEPR